MEEFKKITIGNYNSYFTNAPKYYYSERNPFEGEGAVTEGNYWHYGVNYEILVWTKEQ